METNRMNTPNITITKRQKPARPFWRYWLLRLYP